jgi:hypothetical protein
MYVIEPSALLPAVVKGLAGITHLQAATTTNTTAAATNTTNPVIYSLVSSLSKNPYVAASVIIQLVLGIALGYVSVKALKYVLSFIGILVLGGLLNVWSFSSGSVEETLKQYYQQLEQVMPLLKNLAATIGLLTIGPVSIGYFIGVLIGLSRR